MPDSQSPRKADDTLVDPTPPSPSADVPVASDQFAGEKTQQIDRLTVFLAPPQNNEELGRFAHYRVLSVIGQGGMGTVLLAEDSQLLRKVALKIILPEYASDKEARERFLREARAVAKIKHNNVVTIYQVGDANGIPFFAMELLKGMSLERYLQKKGEVSIGQALRIVRDVAEGLRAAHAEGLIHRDIKPANIWLEAPKGRGKILDFGIAREEQPEKDVTQQGMIIGTPNFMSPEQANGAKLDHRSDLFSLGVVLFRLCTGKEPFDGNTVMALLRAVATEMPRSIHDLNPDVPQPVADLIMRLLAKEPEKRPASAAELVKMLRSIEAGQSQTVPLPEVEPLLESTWESMVTAADSEPVRPRTATDKAKLRRTDIRQILGVAAFVILAGIGIYLLMPRSTSSKSKQEESNSKPPSKVAPGEPAVTQRVYLSTMKPVETRNWPFEPPPDKRDLPNPFQFISVDGKVSPHGIGMHPTWEGSVSLTYSLASQFQDFRGEVSLNDSSKGSSSPMTFFVYGDGQILWKSKPVSGQEDGQSFVVSVKGVKLLKLETAASGPVGGAHGVWIEPVVRK